MTGDVFVLIPSLTEAHRAAITEAADSFGARVRFFGSEADALPQIDHAEVIFAQNTSLTRKAPGLRWLCTSNAGINNYVGEGVFLAKDVILTNSSGAYGVTIAEHVMMLILQSLRRAPEYAEIVRERQWIRNLPVRSVHGSRITLLGTGDIGRETAIRLRSFSPASVTGINRSGRKPGDMFDSVCPQSDMDSVLPETDILIISLPGTADTHHMLDARRLALLPDGALVVNVGRGTVIEQPALEKELRSGRLYAALDVFEQEPVPAEDPIWACPNLLITPHSAGNLTLSLTLDRIVAMFTEDLAHYCSGQPLTHTASLRAGY